LLSSGFDLECKNHISWILAEFSGENVDTEFPIYFN
jgi:hypothetical protein